MLGRRPVVLASVLVLAMAAVGGCGDDGGDEAVESTPPASDDAGNGEPAPTTSDGTGPTPVVSGDVAKGETLSPDDPRAITNYMFEPAVGREHILAHWRENGAALDPVISFTFEDDGWRGLWNVCTTDRDRFAVFFADSIATPGYVYLAAVADTAERLLASVDEGDVIATGSLMISGLEAAYVDARLAEGFEIGVVLPAPLDGAVVRLAPVEHSTGTYLLALQPGPGSDLAEFAQRAQPVVDSIVIAPLPDPDPGAGWQGPDDPTPAVTITELLAIKPCSAAVTGLLFDDGEDLVLCDTFAESFPPQCVGTALQLGRTFGPPDLDAEGLAEWLATERGITVQLAQGVLWSDTPVVVTGERHTDDVFFGDVALPGARLANPAVTFCEEQRGTVSGPEPMCALPDGTVVDAWEHYRAETGTTTGLANPAAVFCEEQGGTVFGPEPTCALPDGTVVDAWEYFWSQTASSPTD